MKTESTTSCEQESISLPAILMCTFAVSTRLLLLEQAIECLVPSLSSLSTNTAPPQDQLHPTVGKGSLQ